MRFAHLTLSCLLTITLLGCNFRYNSQAGMEDKQNDNYTNHKNEQSNYEKEESRESERLLLTLTKTDDYGCISKFEYTYDIDSCIMTVRSTSESSKYLMRKYKITPKHSIEYVDYRNCTVQLSIMDGLITEITEKWHKGNTWSVHYNEDKRLVKLNIREANWDRDKLNQVKTSIYYGPSVNNYVSYDIVQYGDNYVRSSPNLLQELFNISEAEIVFVYIGLYGKLPKTTSRYTIDTYQRDAYVFTTTWSNDGSRQVVKKQKVGSERFSEIFYCWEKENLVFFDTLFK